MKKLLNRRGRIAAPDHKYTGEEPEWDGWQEWDLNTFFMHKIRALKFYTYYVDPVSAKSIVYAWMKKNKYTKEKLAAFDSLSPRQIPTTIGKLVRMLDMGMPDIHPRAKEYFNGLQKYESGETLSPRKTSDIIRTEISAVLAEAGRDFEDKPTSVASDKKPVDMLAETDKGVLSHIDEWIDGICTTRPSRVVAPDILSLISAAKTPKTYVKYVESVISRTAEEFRSAYEKTDDQLAQGYAYLGKPLLRKICECYDSMLQSLRGLTAVKTTTRKPRVKKPRAVEKQVASLKYLESCETYSVKSIHPHRVPFSHVLYVFNTKNRQLSVYYSAGRGGFTVRGCSIKDYDTEKSFTLTLRKPGEILHTIQGNAYKKVEKILSDLNGKKKKANGRINANMILLKAHEI